jgi:hypothetical protein
MPFGEIGSNRDTKKASGRQELTPDNGESMIVEEASGCIGNIFIVYWSYTLQLAAIMLR